MNCRNRPNSVGDPLPNSLLTSGCFWTRLKLKHAHLIGAKYGGSAWDPLADRPTASAFVTLSIRISRSVAAAAAIRPVALKESGNRLRTLCGRDSERGL